MLFSSAWKYKLLIFENVLWYYNDKICHEISVQMYSIIFTCYFLSHLISSFESEQIKWYHFWWISVCFRNSWKKKAGKVCWWAVIWKNSFILFNEQISDPYTLASINQYLIWNLIRYLIAFSVNQQTILIWEPVCNDCDDFEFNYYLCINIDQGWISVCFWVGFLLISFENILWYILSAFHFICLNTL